MLAFLVRDFSNPYLCQDWLCLSEDFNEKGCKVDIIHRRTDTTTKSQELALVFIKEKISLIWTQGRQLTPNCSLCSSRKCVCVRLWNSKINPKEKDSPRDDLTNDNDDDTEEVTDKIHYKNINNRYGYNKKTITIPLVDDPIQLRALETRTESFSGPQG